MMCDFERNIWCLLGLTFDVVNMQQAIESVRHSVSERSRLFISTPNLNFLVASQRDPDFRNSVIASDLSIADGMPLIWIARMLNLPLPERVPGSGMVERLRKNESDPAEQIRVFFFGGDEGVAEQACRVISQEKGGLSCAGHYYPGFCSVADMSSPGTIESINQCSADFVIVALGAKKGQQWIGRNRNDLSAPVICHLGAVINFVAGNVMRAPRWVQAIGLEWLWRIVQEPPLWKRYLFDGLGFLRLLVTQVVPYACWQLFNRELYVAENAVSFDLQDEADLLALKIRGKCLHDNIEPLRTVFQDCSKKQKSIRLELNEVEIVDGAFIGLCMLLWNHQQREGRGFSIVGLSPGLRRIFRWNRADFII